MRDNENMNRAENENISKAMPYHPTPSATPVFGQPMDCYDMVNKYGTYNIQPTNESENEFPAIAQGLSDKEKSRYAKERKQWVKESRERKQDQ